MISRTLFRWSVPALIAGALCLPVSAQTVPAAPDVLAYAQDDLDGDGTPDRVTLTTAYFSARDRVTIFDQGDDMPSGDTWQTTTDLENDVWLFEQVDAPGVRLVLAFAWENSRYVCRLYDDVDGDGRVSLTISAGGRVTVTESPFPTAVISADQPFMLPDGAPNLNVRVEVYRGVLPTVRVEMPFPEDGRVLLERVTYDTDHDGLIEGERTRLFPDIPLDWAYERTGITHFPDGYRLRPFENFAFFPYLGRMTGSPFSRDLLYRYEDDPRPPLLFDWEAAKLRGVIPFAPLWGGSRINYNSYTWLEPYRDTLLHFERFGHYRYTGSSIPDLIIRWSLGQNDYRPSVRVGDDELFTHQIEMSWHTADHAGTLMQDYKLELAGIQPPPETLIRFPDFGIYEYPYADWPRVFTESAWAFATFVATEGKGYETNEAVHEWNAIESVFVDISAPLLVEGASEAQARYLFGETDDSPAVHYQEIRDGLRGEYADLMYTRPMLYFSPVDRKLHLLHASHGVWNVSNRYEIRYTNYGGQTLNGWSLVDKTRNSVDRQLIAAGGLLILSDESGVRLARQAVAPLLFTTLPPRSTTEFEAFNAQLDAHERDLDPLDFAALFAQFGEADVQISGARVSDFRLSDDATPVFTLTLHRGWQVERDRIGLLDAVTGDETLYHVSMDATARTLRVQPLTPPQITLVSADAEPGDPAVELQPQRLWVTLRNDGLQDVHAAQVQITSSTASAADGGVQTLAQAVTALPAGETVGVALLWTPAAAGEHILDVQAAALDPWRYHTGGRLSDATTARLRVAPKGEVDIRAVLSLDGELPLNGAVAPVMLAALAVCAAALLVLIMRAMPEDS
jgi:hypothetical protein